MKTMNENKTFQDDERVQAEKERFAGFVAELRRRGRAQKTIGSYRSDWIGFNDWYGETYGVPFSIETVTADEVRAFIEILQAQELRPATVNRKLVFLKRYITWAYEIGLVGRESHLSLRSVKPVAQGPRRPRGLSDIELKRFLREVEHRASPRDQAIIYTLLGTGLRVSELAELDMSQVVTNGRRCIILVDDIRPHGARIRKLNLAGIAKRKLRQYLICRGRSTGLVFLGERGPLTPNAIQRIVRKYCAFAKVQVSPSTLRHTFASVFLANDGDVVALADLLGHESLETTRLYLNGQHTQLESQMTETELSRPVIIAGGGQDNN